MKPISLEYAMRLAGYEGAVEDGIVYAVNNGSTFPLIRQSVGVIPQYEIRRRCVHDGTLSHSLDLILTAFSPLLSGTTFFKKEPAERGMLPCYTIGDMVIREVKEYKKPEHFTWPTMCEEVIIPVRVEWRFQ